MSINPITKSVQFAGRTLVISQVGNSLRVNLRIAEFRAAEIRKMSERYPAPVEGQPVAESASPISALEENYYFGVYPNLAACTTAEDGMPIPTADEMLDNPNVDETNNWYVAAEQLNKHLFKSDETPQDVPSGVAAEEVKKKRTRSRRAIQPTA